jgi:hypothetical protein
MDDSWAILWGAGIALFSSVLGGALTSLIGPWLARRADEKVRLAQASDASREVVRGALRDLAIGLQQWLDGKLKLDQELISRGELAVVEAQATLRLWTSHEEREVESTVTAVLGAPDVGQAVLRVAAWETCAALWFRDQLDSEEFGRTVRDAFVRNDAAADPLRERLRRRA